MPKPPYPARGKIVAAVKEWIATEKMHFDQSGMHIQPLAISCPQCRRHYAIRWGRGVWKCEWLECGFEFPKDLIVASPNELREEFTKRRREKELQYFMGLVSQVLAEMKIRSNPGYFAERK